MNKEELKQYIDDNIYENPDGEITGESLNAVLKAIVDDGGTEVEANPTGTPTATMEKIKIGETIYTAPQGPPGEPGEDGQDGQPGAPGPANTLIIGTVTDGEQAAASIIGDAPNQVLNLILPKGEKGDPGQNAVNPFKGWWPDLATLKAAITAIPGDYAYVFDPSPATTASIYVYDSSDTDNHWVDSGNDVDASNVSSFMSGQPLNTVNIVDELHDQDPFTIIRAKVDEENRLHLLNAGVFLTGGGSALAGTVELAASVFGCGVRVGSLLPEIEGLEEHPHPAACAVAAGLLLIAQQQSEPSSSIFDSIKKIFGLRK